MLASRLKRNLVGATVAVALCAAGQPAAAAESEGVWSERVQVLYDAETRSVARVRLRAWDAEPERNLEFTWEPDQGSGFDPAATGGVVAGRGKLVWRVKGSAGYDRRAVYSTYTGELTDGRPHGRGRLERRDGEVFEGEWVAGILHGEGMHLDAAGNRYTGTFDSGRPHGQGRQAMADGSIYEGSFRDGLRDGEGRTRLPGGTIYASQWRAGVEIGGERPDALADANIGGLLRAQAGGGEAGKVELSVTIDQRMTRQAGMHYVHVVLDEHVEIYPENPGMVETWIGDAVVEPWGFENVFGGVDWEDVPAYVQVAFETGDGSRVRLDALELQVEDSQVYRKPFLSMVTNGGCVGFRPAISFQNNGWGPVRDARLSLEFFDRENPQQTSRAFDVEVGGFDQAIDVSMTGVLDAAGVDTDALAEGRFSCPSMNEIQQCRQQVTSAVDFGELDGLLSGDAVLWTGVRGRIGYQWADDRGNVYDAEESFETMLQLAAIETNLMVAEGGDGWGSSPEALRYQVVELPSDRQNYVIDMPVRGNKNLAAYVARLKVYAEETSVHRFRAAARFADGSERYSKPISLFYVRPREHFHTPAQPAQCYLDFEYDPMWHR